jgi:putative cell wall teichoic acid glycosylation protein gtcA
MKSIKELFYKYEEIISYLIVGGLTTMVSLITYYLLVYTILDPNIGIELQIANIVSWIFSVTFAYFTNRKYVFKSKNKISFKEGISFYISRIGTLFLDMLMMYVFVTVLWFNDKIIKFVVQIIVIILNYILSKFIVFKKK